MIIYTRYKHSKLATLMSGLGSVAVVGGVYLIAQSVGFMVGSGGIVIRKRVIVLFADGHGKLVTFLLY